MARSQSRTTDQTVSDNAAADAIAESLHHGTFTDADLRGIASFEDALALATATYGDVVDATDEIGSGFVRLDNKSRLIDTPFVIMSFALSEGDYIDGGTGVKQHFASVRVVTRSGDKYWFTDGGTGIYRQLEDMSVRSGRNGGILVDGGLRKSEYQFEDSDGNMQPGTTFYLNV